MQCRQTNTDCTLPPVLAKLLISLDCIHIDGSKYLRTDTSIDCESSDFDHFKTIASIFIAVYLCVPLVWAFLICRIRHQLDPVTRVDATFAQDTEPLRFLLTDYRTHCEYTECVEM